VDQIHYAIQVADLVAHRFAAGFRPAFDQPATPHDTHTQTCDLDSVMGFGLQVTMITWNGVPGMTRDALTPPACYDFVFSDAETGGGGSEVSVQGTGRVAGPGRNWSLILKTFL